MIIFGIGLALALMFPSGSAFAIERNNAIYYLEMVESKGAKYVVREELESWEQWYYVMDQVSAGGTDWIKLTRELRSATDAGKSTSLRVAMASALPENPIEILSSVNIRFMFDDACGFPFIEAEQDYLENHFKSSMAALEKAKLTSDPVILYKCQKELTSQYNRYIKQ